MSAFLSRVLRPLSTLSGELHNQRRVAMWLTALEEKGAVTDQFVFSGSPKLLQVMNWERSSRQRDRDLVALAIDSSRP